MLTQKGLAIDFSNRHREERYIKSLQSYVAYLSCSSNVNITAGKMFEIMSSGGILFTNREPEDRYGLKKLFPDDSYVTYEQDFSDVVSKANRIINDTEWADGVAKRGMEYVKEHHNHKVRIKQLLQIIEKEFGII